MEKTYEVYVIRYWRWDAEAGEYIPELEAFGSNMDHAETVYDKTVISADIPKVELCRDTVLKNSTCVVGTEILRFKEC